MENKFDVLQSCQWPTFRNLNVATHVNRKRSPIAFAWSLLLWLIYLYYCSHILKFHTLTSMPLVGSLLLVRLISTVRRFFGTAIQNMLSRKLGAELPSCTGWGRTLGPCTAKAGAAKPKS